MAPKKTMKKKGTYTVWTHGRKRYHGAKAFAQAILSEFKAGTAAQKRIYRELTKSRPVTRKNDPSVRGGVNWVDLARMTVRKLSKAGYKVGEKRSAQHPLVGRSVQKEAAGRRSAAAKKMARSEAAKKAAATRKAKMMKKGKATAKPKGKSMTAKGGKMGAKPKTTKKKSGGSKTVRQSHLDKIKK